MSPFVQRANQRFVTRGDGWVGRYCFSYAEHYDADNLSFGLLLACNEFVVEPGCGFPTHHHGGIEIVSWVLDGTLLHDEADRVQGLQVVSAGSGVDHSETNPGDGPLRFLQMWLAPAEDGPPAHALLAAPSAFGPVDVPVRQPDARLHAGSLAAGEPAELPEAPFVFVLVADGAAEVAGERLAAGDSVRLAGAATVTAVEDARVLAWAMSSS